MKFGGGGATRNKAPQTFLNLCSNQSKEQNSILSCPLGIKSFTMAEVLITLGIIGIVAAMTLPQLIKNYQAKVYETAFKKAYSNLSKAYLMTQNELGVTNLRKTYATYDVVNKVYPMSKTFRDAFYKQLGVVNIAENYIVTNYNNTQTFYTGNSKGSTDEYEFTGTPRPLRILPDGSSVGVVINAGEIYFDVDTNGPYQKPNRYGFDIFTFAVQDDQDIIKPVKMTKLYTEDELEDAEYPTVAGNPCSSKSNQLSNGISCSYFAINDINPDDNKKSYWKNLPK